MSRILTAALFVLTLSAPCLAETVQGNSDAVTCHEGQPLEGMALERGTVCKRNSEWARLNGGSRFAGPTIEGPRGDVPPPPPPSFSQP
jgi:hypothetical protein